MESTNFVCLEITVEAMKAIFLFLAAAIAARFAWQRYKTADKQLRQERFQTASKLLAEERMQSCQASNIIRVSSIITLGKLSQDSPEKYHVAVMRIFEIFLTWTTTFSSEPRVVDVEASDVVEAIHFVENRTKRQIEVERKSNYEFRLRGESPFFIGADGRLRLKAELVPQVREQLKKRKIDSLFMSQRHPIDKNSI